MYYKMSNNESLKHLLKCLGKIQNSRNPLSRRYEYFHKEFFSLFYKKSSVSISFRLKLTPLNSSTLISKLNESDKKDIVILLDSEILSKNNKGVNVRNIEIFNDKLSIYNLTLEPEVILMQRTSNVNDKFAGQVCFPGGKFEEKDSSILETALRETYEETGFQLLSKNIQDKQTIPSRLVFHSPHMDSPLVSRYLVFSYVFIIFDLFDEFFSQLNICKREVHQVFSVPISFFLDITSRDNPNIVNVPEYMHLLKKNIYLEKIVLNKDPKCLLYGMTLRLLIKILNYSQPKKKIYLCSISKQSESISSLISIKSHEFYKFFMHPLETYRVLSVLILLTVLYFIVKRIVKF